MLFDAVEDTTRESKGRNEKVGVVNGHVEAED